MAPEHPVGSTVLPEQPQEPSAEVEKSPVSVEKQEQLWEMVGDSLTQEEQEQLFLVAMEFEVLFAVYSNIR